MTGHEGDVERRDINLERLVFFSDGVFAIAITLLVIDLKAPEVAEADLAEAVWDLWPAVFSYVLSFLVIGIYWMAHRRIFSFIVRGDGMLTWLSMIYLMLIAFLPFPTAIRGAYDNSRFALIFYAAVHVAIGLASLSLWLYATWGRRLTRPDLPERVVTSGLVNGAVPTAIFCFRSGWHSSVLIWPPTHGSPSPFPG